MFGGTLRFHRTLVETDWFYWSQFHSFRPLEKDQCGFCFFVFWAKIHPLITMCLCTQACKQAPYIVKLKKKKEKSAFFYGKWFAPHVSKYPFAWKCMCTNAYSWKYSKKGTWKSSCSNRRSMFKRTETKPVRKKNRLTAFVNAKCHRSADSFGFSNLNPCPGQSVQTRRSNLHCMSFHSD